MVTGKRIVPMKPMQVVKGDHNGYPVPGGNFGLTWPGSYKYGGLAFRFGERQADNLSP